MLARLQKMFKYTGLPDSIPRQYLENYLLVNGSCIIARDKKNPSDPSIYAFVGSAGGEPDIYYRPTKYMVANPALNFSAEYYISDTDPGHELDAILIRNDTMWQGLYPMMARYAALISENLLTLRTADIMLRILALITAPDDKSREAADIYLKNIVDGKLGSISENRFLDGIRMQNPPSNNGSYLTQFIELHQYLVGSFYNEVGLNANYNMKREALSESETGLNDDSLMPLCEDMLRCRREDIERVNNMFGTSIEVDFDSSWLENTIERLLSIRQQASEASSQLDNPAPLEVGMESVGLEGASMEDVGMEGASGNEDDRMEETGSENEDGEKEPGVEEDGTKEDDNGSNDESNSEEQSSEEEGTNDSDKHDEDSEGDEGNESEQGDSEEESNNENGRIDETIDESIEAPGVEVNVEVNFMNSPEARDSNENDESDESDESDGTDGTDEEKEESINGTEDRETDN